MKSKLSPRGTLPFCRHAANPRIFLRWKRWWASTTQINSSISNSEEVVIQNLSGLCYLFRVVRAITWYMLSVPSFLEKWVDISCSRSRFRTKDIDAMSIEEGEHGREYQAKLEVTAPERCLKSLILCGTLWEDYGILIYTFHDCQLCAFWKKMLRLSESHSLSVLSWLIEPHGLLCLRAGITFRKVLFFCLLKKLILQINQNQVLYSDKRLTVTASSRTNHVLKKRDTSCSGK